MSFILRYHSAKTDLQSHEFNTVFEALSQIVYKWSERKSRLRHLTCLSIFLALISCCTVFSSIWHASSCVCALVGIPSWVFGRASNFMIGVDCSVLSSNISVHMSFHSAIEGNPRAFIGNCILYGWAWWQYSMSLSEQFFCNILRLW